MNRRKFLHHAGIPALFAMAPSAFPFHPPARKASFPLQARDIQSHLRSLVEVPEPSVDRIVIGNPETEVSGIGTAWMPTWTTCRRAVALGVNVLVVHEPAFYTHWDLDARKGDFFDAPEPARRSYLALREEKKKWIDEKGLVIIRCHDVLDRIVEFGIPSAFGEILGFAGRDRIRSKQFYQVYRIPKTTAADAARMIASRLKPLNQPGVAFYGDPDRPVETVGLGTGCICDPMEYMELDPDLFIAIDDTVRTWIQTLYAEDSGRPLVVVNHGTTEENGMRLLNRHLKQAFPGMEVAHLDQGCGYRWITG